MSKQVWKGHVQTAFEIRIGATMQDWLLEHGPTMTRLAASEEIGYTSPSALGDWVTRHMPEGFKFYRRPAKFSVDQLTTAIERRAAGSSWVVIAIGMGGDVNGLKESCRRHKKRQKAKA